MNSFPSSMTVGSPAEAPICSICHDHLYPAATKFGSWKVAVARPCNHEFHTSCISRWLQDHFDCPLGKRTIERLEVRLPLRPGWQNQMVSAAGRGDIGLIRALLQRGADVDAGRTAGNTPLALAVKNKHIDIALLLANRGATDPIGLNNLGAMCRRRSNDLLAHLHHAETWLLKAAKLGSTAAMSNLGCLYLQGGKDFTTNLRQAEIWLLKAATLNHAPAMNNLGHLYHKGGKDFPVDLHRAKAWLLKAIEQGHVPAMSKLGYLYYEGGKDFPADLQQAEIWFLKAARLGHAPAMNNLGCLYHKGNKDFPVDLHRAESWLLKAAGLGHAPAMNNLGNLYLEGGQDFPANLHRAETWLLKRSELEAWFLKAAEM